MSRRLAAEPLDPGDEQVIGRIHQESDQPFVLSAEMEPTQRHGNVLTLVGPALVLHRVNDHDRIQERRQRPPHSWSQVTELLPSRAVQLLWSQIHGLGADVVISWLEGAPRDDVDTDAK